MSAPDTNLSLQTEYHRGPLLGFGFIVTAILACFVTSLFVLAGQARPVRDTGPMVNDQTGALIQQGPGPMLSPDPTLPQAATDRGYGQQGFGETPAELAAAGIPARGH